MSDRSQLLLADLLKKLLAQCSTLIIDLDGVVYKGKQMIAGADVAIKRFRQAGKKIIFLTNNSAGSTLAIWQKLNDFGIDCDRQEILTSAEAAAHFIAQQCLDRGHGVFVIGTEALQQEVKNHGLKLADPDHCGAILVGLDAQFDYQAIALALRALNRGAKFIACNLDANFPTEGGQSLPGCGAMVAAIAAAAERTVDFAVGKPNTIMLDIVTDRMQITLDQCLVIGDMLASDILMANRANIPSIWITETKSKSEEQFSGKFLDGCASDFDDDLANDVAQRSPTAHDLPQPTLSMASLEAISQYQ